MLALEAARSYGAESTWANLDLPLYNGDVESAEGIPDPVTRLGHQIREAQAVIIATPEYNQSLSGVLKNALDWISRLDEQGRLISEAYRQTLAELMTRLRNETPPMGRT